MRFRLDFGWSHCQQSSGWVDNWSHEILTRTLKTNRGCRRFCRRRCRRSWRFCCFDDFLQVGWTLSNLAVSDAGWLHFRRTTDHTTHICHNLSSQHSSSYPDALFVCNFSRGAPVLIVDQVGEYKHRFSPGIVRKHYFEAKSDRVCHIQVRGWMVCQDADTLFIAFQSRIHEGSATVLSRHRWQ